VTLGSREGPETRADAAVAWRATIVLIGFATRAYHLHGRAAIDKPIPFANRDRRLRIERSRGPCFLGGRINHLKRATRHFIDDRHGCTVGRREELDKPIRNNATVSVSDGLISWVGGSQDDTLHRLVGCSGCWVRQATFGDHSAEGTSLCSRGPLSKQTTSWRFLHRRA
jgi:hypothetical protein